MESTTTLTLDGILEYEEADTGDCIVEVPPVSTDNRHGRIYPPQWCMGGTVRLYRQRVESGVNHSSKSTHDEGGGHYEGTTRR